MSKRTCVNPACRTRFNPDHRGHFWCQQMCRQSHFKAETGKHLSGAFGFGTDPNLVRGFDEKWIRNFGRVKPMKKKVKA
ncbi:hypothetical protein CcrC1_gp357 [Caulobacter phage C1]|nr:hypothetical protein CcrC1_gp357 [Caulobacter phage C1]UTU08586.1 hypothetical protein CcrC2_gp358 [Caulobacter phage C2]UTU09102.1 hypothetical protein CcrJ4_gp353 [Caulobacter phage J4]UTU09660.1 hypothetical protein CcrBL47_gp375 [Caulobacter phage BL47]UTU10219.1 hypothetical protein CcrRB23_gp357 [Caulobacter phage RB23]WGN97253.1 hypothetical protein [Bertelyvirus sp.]